MNIKIHSAELNRMMKTVGQCIDDKFDKFSNIEICYANNLLTIRGTNGTVAAKVSTPLLGGDGEKFCVDGSVFQKVCSMCGGEITITTDDKNCTIKGNGRTRLPIVKADVPEYKGVDDEQPGFVVKAEDFAKAFGGVSHAIATDQSRIQLTGVQATVDVKGLHFTALDGFRMAAEWLYCDGDDMKVVIPGTFMKLVQSSTADGENITFRIDGKKVEAITETMRICGGLLVGEGFPDVTAIVPKTFSTECLVKVSEIRDALKSSGVLNTKSNLVKVEIGTNQLKIMSNSDKADFEAAVDCDVQGNGLLTAFNQKYLVDTFNSIDEEETIMKFNSAVSPCVIHGKDAAGFRLLLPVRVFGDAQ